MVKLGKRVSGRDVGQTPPRLLPYLRFGLDTNKLARKKEGLMTLSERISAKGPKRILALDGGGIRGIITFRNTCQN